MGNKMPGDLKGLSSREIKGILEEKIAFCMDVLVQYQEIGTVRECRIAVDRQRKMKPVFYGTKFMQRGRKYGECVSVEDAYCCPSCNGTLWGCDKHGFCPDCGQALEWQE